LRATNKKENGRQLFGEEKCIPRQNHDYAYEKPTAQKNWRDIVRPSSCSVLQLTPVLVVSDVRVISEL